MQRICPNNPVVLIHVMKTAGLSVQSAIGTAIGDKYCCKTYNESRIAGEQVKKIASAMDLKATHFYTGHFQFDDINALCAERSIKPFYISFVREPYQRIRSLRTYLAGQPNDPLHNIAITGDINSFFDALIKVNEGLVSNTCFKAISDRHGSSDTIVNVASNMDFLGTLDQFGEFEYYMEKRFGMDLDIRHLNRSERRFTSPLLEAESDKILDMNEKDSLIYDFLIKNGPIMRF